MALHEIGAQSGREANLRKFYKILKNVELQFKESTFCVASAARSGLEPATANAMADAQYKTIRELYVVDVLLFVARIAGSVIAG